MVISLACYRQIGLLLACSKNVFLTKGEDYCRKGIWEFVSKGLTLADLTDTNSIEFHEGISEAYLYFIHNIMPEFNSTIKALGK